MTGTLVEHLQNVLKKVSRTIDFLRNLQNNLPRFSLVIIYKSLIRQHLDMEIFYATQRFSTPCRKE